MTEDPAGPRPGPGHPEEAPDAPPPQDVAPGTQPAEEQGNLQRDPDDWKTGDEPMTAAQASYLRTLCEEAGEQFDEGLTKAAASKRIDELQGRTGRGQGGS